jgi:hypothetical protein
LLNQREDLESGFRFRYWRNPDGPSENGSRLAWCYGDLGVACALARAADLADRADWKESALETARNCATIRDGERTRIVDHGLCHGYAGAGHLFLRLSRLGHDPVLEDAARHWFQCALAERLDDGGIAGYAAWQARSPDAADARLANLGYVAQPGLLVGAMGVALALAAAVTDVAPDWDRFLLLT